MNYSAELDTIAADFGIDFDLIVIDQLELWIMGRGETPDQRTIKRFCKGLKQFANHSGIPVLLLHQMASSLKSELAARKPEVTDAMHSRSFGSEDVDVGLFIGCLDEQNICWIPANGTPFFERRFPGLGILRKEGLRFMCKRFTDNFAAFGERGDVTHRQHLDNEVADGRGFDRAGGNFPSGSIGREWTERFVLASAAID